MAMHRWLPLKRPLLLAGGALLCTAAPALAQQQTPPAGDRDIVVCGAGLDLPPGTPAYGAVVIDRARLVANGSERVETILRDVAGFQQFRRSDSRSANPSAQGATLRALGGNAASRTLILLDGVPVADPFFGYVPFNAIVPERLSTVRITRGSGAGPFGAGAVAGTIELVSADRRDLPSLAGEASYGSNDASSLSLAAAPRAGGGFIAVSGKFERGDGFQTTPVDQRVPATVRSRYRDWSSALRMVAPFGSTGEVQVNGLVSGDDRTLRFRGADASSSGQDASIRLIDRGPWQVDALAYVQARNFTNRVISATTARLTLDQRATPSTGLGGKIELRPPVGTHHVLRLGLDTRGAQGELFEDAYGANGVTARRRAGGRSTVTGVFAEDDWTLGRLVLTGGGRLDRWTLTRGAFAERDGAGTLRTRSAFPDRSGTEVTARGGVAFRADPALTLRAAAYSGFRLPTLNELYRPFVVFPVTTEANAALAPERLQGAEVGASVTPAPSLTAGVTLFYNRLNDAIANVTVGANLRRRENVDAIVARGVEAEVGWRRGAWSLAGSYALSDSRVRAPGVAFDGRRPAQSPRHSATATIAWRPAEGPVLSTTLRYTGAQYEDDLGVDRLPPATTLDLFGSMPLVRRIALVLRAENLFDARIVTRNQGGSIDLGTPRTLWAGVRFGG